MVSGTAAGTAAVAAVCLALTVPVFLALTVPVPPAVSAAVPVAPSTRVVVVGAAAAARVVGALLPGLGTAPATVARLSLSGVPARRAAPGADAVEQGCAVRLDALCAARQLLQASAAFTVQGLAGAEFTAGGGHAGRPAATGLRGA